MQRRIDAQNFSEGRDVNRWTRWLPGLQVLRRYEPAWLPYDLMAGLVLTTMLVPVGIAYAVASGVPGIYGLYATIVPLLAYALFGPSRILVLGPDSSLAAVILAVVLPLSGGDPMRAFIPPWGPPSTRISTSTPWTGNLEGLPRRKQRPR